MKVDGQLENAQLEQIAATTTTPASTGRVFSDVTNPLAAKPMYYNGAAWKQLAFEQATPLISQNSGKTVTVDWSTGLNQQVVLTDNALISFSNPQDGKIHLLTVTQKDMGAASASVLQYQFKLNMTDQHCAYSEYQPQGVIPNGKTKAYRWFYKAAIRAAYTTIPSSTMSVGTLPSTLVTGLDIAPDRKSVLMGRTSSPFTSIFSLFDNSTINESVLGVSPMTPVASAAQVLNVCFHPTGKLAVVASGSTPFIQGWYVDNGSPFGSALANPGTLPTGAGRCLGMHPSGFFFAIGHTTSPFMSCYPLNASNGWGTKLTDPATLPAAAVTAVAFSPFGDFMTVASQTTPFIQTYPFTGNNLTGSFGTVVSNPATLPAGGPAGSLGKGVAWRPQGDYIAMAMTASPYLYVVPFDRSTGAYGTRLVITALSGAANCVQWTPDGQYLLVGTTVSPFLYVFDFSANTIGTAVAFDGSNPGQQVNDIAVSSNGDYALLGLNASPFIIGYTLPTKARNYLRID